MYYPCSENKDADQLRGYREADLRLCFRPCKLLVFSCTGSNNSVKTQGQIALWLPRRWSALCFHNQDSILPLLCLFVV